MWRPVADVDKGLEAEVLIGANVPIREAVNS
jgi:hypothetical protein